MIVGRIPEELAGVAPSTWAITLSVNIRLAAQIRRLLFAFSAIIPVRKEVWYRAHTGRSCTL